MTKTSKTRLLVLGATGMIGHAVLRFFAESPGYFVLGSSRLSSVHSLLPSKLCKHIICGIDLESRDGLTEILEQSRPDIVINCVGITKQLVGRIGPLATIAINSLLPHRLAQLCDLVGARLIHLSTDCVFAGTQGMYKEKDISDAQDLYGRSKYLGEVDYPHALTLRTSTVGHELRSQHGLLEWFLAQQGPVKGFARAVFSGLPTVEIARIIRDYIIPNQKLRGLYHVSGDPINKYELLNLFAQTYGHVVPIISDDSLVVDRSLNSTRFREETGYNPPNWAELARFMCEFS